MKNTHGLNRWVVFFWWYFKVFWLLPFPLSFLTLSTRRRIGEGRRKAGPSWLNTHIRNIHAWLSLLASSRYIYAHLISLPCSSSFCLLQPSSHAMWHGGPRIRWQVYFLLLLLLPWLPFRLRCFSVIWFKYIGQAEKERNGSPLSALSMHGHTRACMLMIYFIADPCMCFHHQPPMEARILQKNTIFISNFPPAPLHEKNEWQEVGRRRRYLRWENSNSSMCSRKMSSSY